MAASDDPRKLGKPLQDELRGIYRIPFGRYRILYQVHSNGELSVVVVWVGLRKQGDKNDVYQVALRLRRRGEL